MSSTIISLACSGLCCLASLVGLVLAVVLIMRFMRGGGDDGIAGSLADPDTSAKTEEAPKKAPVIAQQVDKKAKAEKAKAEAGDTAKKEPDLPPPDKLGKVPIQTSDPFDEDEMATVVAPPSMMNEVPSAPPPPPPAPKGDAPADPDAETHAEKPPPPPEPESEPEAPAEPPPPPAPPVDAETETAAQDEEPPPPPPKKPTPPPAPPRSSGQTIIAFDDDEDF